MTAPYYGRLDPTSGLLSDMRAFDGSQASLPNYVPLVTMPAGAPGTQYTATGPDASGMYAAVVSLAMLQATAAATLTAQANAAIDGAFNAQTRDWCNYLYAQAHATGLTNRAAYLDQLGAWGGQVFGALAQALAAVQAATDAAGVAAVALTVPAAPSVTLQGALAITN